jgi:hypothetical protein
MIAPRVGGGKRYLKVADGRPSGNETPGSGDLFRLRGSFAPGEPQTDMRGAHQGKSAGLDIDVRSVIEKLSKVWPSGNAAPLVGEKLYRPALPDANRLVVRVVAETALPFYERGIGIADHVDPELDIRIRKARDTDRLLNTAERGIDHRAPVQSFIRTDAAAGDQENAANAARGIAAA